jgi:exonuclease III
LHVHPGPILSGLLWNPNGFTPEKKAWVQTNVIDKTHPDVLVLPEIKRADGDLDKTIELHGYDVIAAPRDAHGGGIAMYVNTDKWRYVKEDNTDTTVTDSAIRVRLFHCQRHSQSP